MGRSIKILMVEDSAYDAELAVRALIQGGFTPQYHRVDNYEQLKDALNEDWDLITCDHSMPCFSAPEALDLIMGLRPDIPVFILSGEIDLSLAVSLMKKGAWDYIQKSDIGRLPLSIERELENALLMKQRQEAEAARQTSEKSLRAIFDNTYDALIIYDNQGNLKEVNQSFLKLYKAERATALQLNISDIAQKDYLNQNVEGIWINCPDGEEVLFEARSWTISARQPFDVEVGLKPISWQGNDAILASIRDISDRKKLERNLREKEGVYRLITENMRDTVWMMDMSMVTTWISPSVIRTRGYKLEELQAMPLEQHVTAESLARVQQDIISVLVPERLADPDDEITHSGEYEYIRRDGSTFWADTSMTIVRDEEGRPIGMLCVARDISARKKAEKTVKEKEIQLAALLESLPLDFWVRDREGRIVIQSTHGKRFWGDMEGKEPGQFEMAAEILEGWDERFQRALRGEEINEIQTVIIHGKKFYLDAVLAPIYSDSNVVGVVGFNRDVSQIPGAGGEMGSNGDIIPEMKPHHIGQHSVFDNNEAYRLQYQDLPDFVFVLDLNANIRLINRMGQELTGYSEVEARNLKIFDLVSPEYLDYVQKVVWPELVVRGSSRLELDILTRDGQRISMDCLTSLVYKDGVPVLIQGVARDVSVQKDIYKRLEESEARFRSLSENSAVWVFIIQDDSYVYVNPAFTEATGYELQEIQGRNYLEKIHPDSRADLQNFCRKRIENGEKEGYCDLKYVARDGREVWVTISLGEMQYNGRPALMGSAFDISQRKTMEEQLISTNARLNKTIEEMIRLQKTMEEHYHTLETQEQALQASEQQYRTLLELIPQGVYEFDLEGRITYANKNALEMFLATEKELEEGIQISELFLPREYEQILVNIQRIAEGFKSKGHEYLCVRRDGTLIYILAYLAPVIENGCVKAFRGTVLNIDERKRIENELLRLNNELEARVERRTRELEILNRELEAFSYMAGHDLRAPLRAIEGFTKILGSELGDTSNPEVNRLMDIICRNVDKMKLLLSDLLEFSKYNRQSINKTTVDMRRLAEEVIDEIQSMEPERIVEWDIGDMVPAECDPGLIRQVLFNLCSNAWKFSAMNACPAISLFSWVETDELVYVVQDNGVGFDMKYYDRLFNVFQRLHTEADFEGTGLGLAIVQRIIARHGGRVWAHSEPAIGASFYFTLPRTKS